MKLVKKIRAATKPPDIRNRIIEIVDVRAGDLVPNSKNYRRHPGAQEAALKGVLGTVGKVDVLLGRRLEDGQIMLIDGHLRQSLDPNEVWKVAVTDLTEQESDMVLATLDPISALAEIDVVAFEELTKNIEVGNDEIDKVLQSVRDTDRVYQKEEEEGGLATTVEEDPGPDIDRAEELRAKWNVETGQLWALGDHRLICGDCTDRAVVERVMGGEKAQIVFTDPPYGVSVGAKNRMLNTFQPSGRCRDDIESDSLKPDELKAVLLPAFVNIREVAMADDCTVFVTAPQGGELGMMMMMMQEARLPVRHVLIWKKNCATFSMGRLDYDYQHEPILLTWGKRHKRPMLGQHKTSVWEIDKPTKSKEHPTMKPVELVVNALMNNSDAGDISFDAYSGSGTTLIASEQTGRRCRAIEIAPKYVAVALERWAMMTGKTPILLEG